MVRVLWPEMHIDILPQEPGGEEEGRSDSRGRTSPGARVKRLLAMPVFKDAAVGVFLVRPGWTGPIALSPI